MRKRIYEYITAGEKQSRLIARPSGQVVERRVVFYKTSFGPNTMGYEVLHQNEVEAMEKQKDWLRGKDEVSK